MPTLRITPPLPRSPNRPAASLSAAAVCEPMVRFSMTYWLPSKTPLKLFEVPIGVQSMPERSISLFRLMYWP
mgnify:CR=1 FL=1